MKVTLYRYIGDSDTANKLLRKCTVVYDKEVIPYGAFNPNGAAFRLDTLHDVNYAKFTYNSHDYYGYVDVSTDSKGIYNYSITTDPLTTAWYAGCFNTGNVCKYSDYGTLLIQDSRATDDSEKTWLIKTFDPFKEFTSAIGDWYIVTVLNSQIENQNIKINNPIFSSFAMNGSVFNEFMTNFQGLTGEDQYKFAPSIISVYSVRGYEIGLTTFTQFPSTKVIRLYSLTAPGADGKIAKIDHKDINLTTGTAYRVDSKNSGQSYWNSCGGFNISTTDNNGNPIVATSSNLNTQFQLHIPDCGDIKFTLRNILEYKHFDSEAGFSIYSIGYKKYYDFISGVCKAYLVINDSVGSSLTNTLPQYSINATMPIKLPILYDNSLQDWRAAKNSLVTSGVGFITSVAATIGAAAATAASGGAATPALIAAGTSLATATTGMANSINAFEHQKYQDENATVSTTCGAGGSVDFAETPWLIAWYNKSHNLADIQGKFGKPDGLVRVVGNLKGWVQTEACHLPSNGLPFDIITQAEQLANNGFRIVS